MTSPALSVFLLAVLAAFDSPRPRPGGCHLHLPLGLPRRHAHLLLILLAAHGHLPERRHQDGHPDPLFHAPGTRAPP